MGKRPSSPADTIRKAEAVAASLAGKTDPASVNTRAVALDRAAALKDKGRIVGGLFDELARIIGPSPRAKPPPRSRFRDDMFERPSSPFFRGDWTREDVQDVWDRFTRHMAEGGLDVAAAERERRASAAREARASESAPEAGPAWPSRDRVDRAISYLWGMDVRVYQGPDAGEWGDALKSTTRRWIIPDESEVEYSDEGIVEVAVARGFEASASRGASGRVYTDRFGDATRIEPAAAFLRGKGLKVEQIPDSDFWSVDGSILQTRTMILAAELRGFAP